MEVLVVIVILVVAAGYYVSIAPPNQKIKNPKNPKYPQIEKSHKFHEPIGEMDETHEDRIGKKLVEHPKAEAGYIVLNGVKRKLEDCKDL